ERDDQPRVGQGPRAGEGPLAGPRSGRRRRGGPRQAHHRLRGIADRALVARLLHGRPLAERIKGDTRARAERLRARNIQPTLAIVGLGAEPAAHAYVQRLERSAKESGIEAVGGFMARDTTERQLISHLERLSADVSVNGILLLTPLPGALD